jgi:hypothetical protein
MKALVLNALGREFDFEEVDIAAPAGREVMDIVKPTNGKVIARVTLGDEKDTRRSRVFENRDIRSMVHSLHRPQADQEKGRA